MEHPSPAKLTVPGIRLVEFYIPGEESDGSFRNAVGLVRHGHR
jgi:hypothetical protein